MRSGTLSLAGRETSAEHAVAPDALLSELGRVSEKDGRSERLGEPTRGEGMKRLPATFMLLGLVGTPATAEPVIVAAGDIACDPDHRVTARTCRHRATSNLVRRLDPTRVLTLGDNQYEEGELANFNRSYDPTWGRFFSRTRPSVGNHEYRTAGAAGYWNYFGSKAGPRGKGWYSFDLGTWHLIALNANCSVVGCGPNSEQVTWLRNNLRTNGDTCELVFYHQARWSSGPHGDHPSLDAIWHVLYSEGVDVALAGHDHLYERFAPQNSNGVAAAGGVRQFVVGTGGRSLYDFGPAQPNSQTRIKAFGVIKLNLHTARYTWNFHRLDQTSLDSGSRACHD
jgi:acid phosphatase type 7